MVAIKTPPPIPRESAPADCRRHPHGDPTEMIPANRRNCVETAQGNRIRRPMNRRANATQQADEQTGLVALFLCFVLELCFGAVQQRVDTPPPADNPVDGDEEGTDARCAPTRPRLHCTEDLCHQSGGIVRRTRPEKRAPSMRPTHKHLTRRSAPKSTARPRATLGSLAPPTPAAHAAPAMHSLAAPHQPPAPRARSGHPRNARSGRRVSSSRRCHPPPRQPPQAPAA